MAVQFKRSLSDRDNDSVVPLIISILADAISRMYCQGKLVCQRPLRP